MSAPRWSVLVLHGPNLNLLGEREPAIYGDATLADVDAALAREGAALGAAVTCFQSNHEGALIDRLHDARRTVDGVVLNAGGLTHTSVALLDALRACALPTVECHLSHPAAREPFRRRSRVAPACVGAVSGFGVMSYTLALRGLIAHLDQRRTDPETSP
ncbi:MAG: type II 3-dehydroquinate dehydratase [Deltaproteobacteria bacterium]|nr:type II 3-dehydroquinate dehydratase [Myxococcales bacterium]MDP3218689.1 type II 3-dehydroquinate dehydratase [Deltaproteobacteria bacterium]